MDTLDWFIWALALTLLAAVAVLVGHFTYWWVGLLVFVLPPLAFWLWLNFVVSIEE